MKWNFSQLRTRLGSLHLYNTLSRFDRHPSKDGPKTEKLSMKTSMHFSTMSEKIAIIHLKNVAGALHQPKGMRRYANMQKGQVKAVYS